eukprot:gene1504-biopygen1250
MPKYQQTQDSDPPALQELQIWGNHTFQDLIVKFDSIYNEIVFWRRNLFKLPSGSEGKKFVHELVKWFDHWNSDALNFKDIAMKVVMVMPALLLQRPSYKSTSKQHTLCLSRRLALWHSGDFEAILREVRAIQKHLKSSRKELTDEQLAKTFSKLMLEGKVKAALNLLDQSTRGGVLPLSNDTILELQKKHPQAADIDESVLLQGPIPFVDPVFFENLDDSIILKAAMQTRGSSGPSGLDTEGWRRILVSKSFGNIGQNLRNSLASFARKICSIDVHITANSSTNIGSIEAYLACRLIPLDKCPGVRPIGVGTETYYR